MDMCRPRRTLHSFVIDLLIWNAEGDIFSHCCIRKVDALRNIADIALPASQVFFIQRLSRYPYFTGFRREQAKNQVHDSTFASASTSNKGNTTAGLYLQFKIGYHRLLCASIAKC